MSFRVTHWCGAQGGSRPGPLQPAVGHVLYWHRSHLVINDTGWELSRSAQGLRRTQEIPPAEDRAPPCAEFSRKRQIARQPVENLEVGHHISTVAHLGIWPCARDVGSFGIINARRLLAMRPPTGSSARPIAGLEIALSEPSLIRDDQTPLAICRIGGPDQARPR